MNQYYNSKELYIPAIGIGPGMFNYKHHDLIKYHFKGAGRINNYWTNNWLKPRQEQEFVDSISNALQIGFRLLDYSAAYGDGKLVGEAIRKSGIPRDVLFITTRVSNCAQREHRVKEEFIKCIHNMGLDYVDLLQFHWPVTGLYLDTWKEMEKLHEDGYVKHLGVANCHQHHLEDIFKICKYRPKVGQFEIHPLFTQKPLIEYYKQQGVIIEAYTPVARYDDRLVRLPLLHRLGKKYNKTIIQIVLRWHIQNGCIPLVRSLNPKHQQENFDIFDFELEDVDMKAIDGININSRLRYDPDNCDFSIL